MRVWLPLISSPTHTSHFNSCIHTRLYNFKCIHRLGLQIQFTTVSDRPVQIIQSDPPAPAFLPSVLCCVVCLNTVYSTVFSCTIINNQFCHAMLIRLINFWCIRSILCSEALFLTQCLCVCDDTHKNNDFTVVTLHHRLCGVMTQTKRKILLWQCDITDGALVRCM